MAWVLYKPYLLNIKVARVLLIFHNYKKIGTSAPGLVLVPTQSIRNSINRIFCALSFNLYPIVYVLLWGTYIIELKEEYGHYLKLLILFFEYT